MKRKEKKRKEKKRKRKNSKVRYLFVIKNKCLMETSSALEP
jgi:hypothetical protein